ncbi:trypsin-like peptidase domain-containing protein, partial [uncultured Caulobacter sp.]|uniref:S1C family serine protease n=1 Tax=uncultured Caulobacter sp. TaxID=158749 RepID=UPI002621C2B8
MGPAAGPTTRTSAPDTFAPVIERVAPAVVSIYAEGAPSPPILVVPDLPFFQPEFIPPTRRMSSGSGFFISADGYVLTNHHVVEGAERVEVVLHNERRLKARLIGSDPATDLAVLKVSGGRFSYVDLQRAGAPKVGDWVIAIGNPFGLGATATAGIVSAYGRDLGSAFVDYVQIDAPINRGNSGGPTFNTQGEVVGVNTAIYSPSGGNVGIAFAIPAATVQSVVEQLKEHGADVERDGITLTLRNDSHELGKIPTLFRRVQRNLFAEWHRILYEIADVRAEALEQFISTSWPLNTASGWVLDQHWGPYHDIERNGMDDDTFRLYVRAKRMLNHSWGAADQGLKILRFLLGPVPTLVFTFWGNKHWTIEIGG